MNKVRLQISLDPKVLALLDDVGNRSAYLERLIVREFQEANRETVLDALIKKIVSDPDTAFKIAQALGYTQNNTPQSGSSPTATDDSPCCSSNVRCKHWTWDGVAEVWSNTLTGEIREK